jgi:hypothetical protein
MINSTTTELPKKAVALHALPRPRDRYRGTRATIALMSRLSQLRGRTRPGRILETHGLDFEELFAAFKFARRSSSNQF